jgi:hypothetical protein
MRRHRQVFQTERRSDSMEKLLRYFADFEPHRLTANEAAEFGVSRPQDSEHKRTLADSDRG